MADLPTFGELRNNLNLKYYGIAGSNPYLAATIIGQGREYSVVVSLSDEVSKAIDLRISEALLAMQAYAIEHPEEDKAAEVINTRPRHPAGDKISDDSSMVISPKTPKQLEKEEEEQIDKLGSE